MRNFLILAAVASMAVLCVAWQVSNTTTFDNVVVRTNLTLGGVPLSAWPSGSGDVLASNQMTNQMPLLGAGGVAIFATNTVGFRSAVGLVIGTDVQAFSSTLADWANLPTNSISAFLTEAEASALYQSTNANLTGWSAIAATSAGVQATLGQVYQSTNVNLTAYAADDYAAVTNALALTGSTSTFLRSDGTQAAPSVGGVSWGAISGDLPDQTDLGTALSARRLFREAPLNVSGTEIDLSLTNRVFSKATAGNTTLTFANPTAGDFFSLIVTNGGSDTLAFPTVTWLAGSAPVLDTGAGTINVFYFYYTGAVYIGDVGQKSSTILDAIAALANGTGALTNNGSGTFGYYDYSANLSPLPSDTAFASSWNGVTTIPPTKNAVYDWAHIFDTDDDGKVNVLDLTAGIPKTDANGVLSVASAGTDYVAPSTTITVAGTANEITSSAGAQDLSANRTWTLSLPTSIDLGGKTSFEIPNGASPTVDAFGEIAGDNDLWGAGRGAIVAYDGTAATALVGVLASDTPSNGQVPKWNTDGTITWEDDNNSGGGSTNITMTSLGTTITPAFSLTNSTAAAAGAQQVSPAFLLGGQGWKTTATAASQPVAMGLYMLPVQGSANPAARLHPVASINGAATYATGPYFDSGGFFNATYQTIQNQLRIPSRTTVAQITSDQNDYSPTGAASTQIFRLSSDASRNITGWTAGVDGQLNILVNVGSFNIVLINASGSSAAANQFALTGDLTILPNAVVIMYYDVVSTKWRKVY